MNLEHELVFALIEEDNVQRAYFRVRPLLTLHGDVQEEAARLWPDGGCLRVVPDRNEQHTFKERMRSLGGWCVMDLMGIPADANKIRTNKNYRPERGEINQYVLYSDTVRPLPEHTFFEVLEGAPEDYAALAGKAVTPLFYIRREDTLFGPVRRSEPEKPETAAAAEGVLYPLTCPDQPQRMLLCMEEKRPVPNPKPAPAEDEPLPIGRTLNILDQNKNFEETLQGLDQPLSSSANLLRQPQSGPASSPKAVRNDPAQPLTGTPLIRAQVRTSVPPPKNRLQEVVASQWRVARNEPPAEPLPSGARLRQVENPVENACTAMRAAWQMPEARNQLVDFLLSLDGMRAKIEPKLAASAGDSALQRVLQSRLQDLEAERLSALLQLDRAKGDLENFRKEIINSMPEKLRQENARYDEALAAHEASIAHAKKELNELLAQRDELLHRVDELRQSALPAALAKALADAQMAAPMTGTPLRMTCVSGMQLSPEALVDRWYAACGASGMNISRNEAVALLALLAICPRIGLAAATPAAAATFMRNIALHMGWLNGFAQQVSQEQRPLISPAPADATPALLLTALPAYAPLEHATKVLLARGAAPLVRNVAYETSPWPVYPMNALPYVPEQQEDTSAEPVSAASLQALAACQGASDAEIDQALQGVLAQIAPLSGAAGREMHRFVSACAALMEGGLPAACDWAILLWVLPAMERSAKAVAAMRPLLEEYPLSMARLQA